MPHEHEVHRAAIAGGVLVAIAACLVAVWALGRRGGTPSPDTASPPPSPLTTGGVGMDPVDDGAWTAPGYQAPHYSMPPIPLLPSFDVHFGDFKMPDAYFNLNVTKYNLPPWIVNNILRPLEIDFELNPILRPLLIKEPDISFEVSQTINPARDNCGCNPVLKSAAAALTAKLAGQFLTAPQMVTALSIATTQPGATVPGYGEPA